MECLKLSRSVNFSIETASGNNYVRLQDDKLEIKAKATFTADSPALNQVKQISKADKLNALLEAKKQIQIATQEAERHRQRLASEIEQNKQAFNTFKNTTFETFKDGIITEPEKQAIKSQKQLLENEKADLLKECTEVLNDPNLPTNEKNLLNAVKSAYVSAFDNLIRAINNATDDGAITDAERTSVNNGFTSYRTALENLRKKLVESIKLIEQKEVEDAERRANIHAENKAQRKYDDAVAKARELDDAQVIGGTNLLKQSNRKIKSSNYKLAEYYLTEKIEVGEDCVLTIWGELGSDRSHFRAYNSGGMLDLSDLEKIKEGVYQAKFKWKKSFPYKDSTYICDDTFIRIYQFDNSGTSSSRIEKIQLERGTKATGWTPAPEDTQAEIAQAKREARERSNNLATEIAENKKALTDFKVEIDKAFKDGIIDKAEKEAIKSHKEILLNEYKDLERQKDSVINDTHLQYKSNLTANWGAYNTTYDTLIKAINNAIADNKIEPKERIAVESGFNNYRNNLVALRGALEDAIKSIETAKIDAIEIGGRNLLIGSSNYDISNPLISQTKSNDFSVREKNGKISYFNRLEKQKTYFVVKLPENLTIGQKYTFSFKWYRDYALHTFSFEYEGEFQYFKAGNSKDWNFVSFTFEKSETNVLKIDAEPATEWSIFITELQLEKGTKATDWRLADEDIQEQIGYNVLKNPNFKNYDFWNFTSRKVIKNTTEYASNFGTVIDIWEKCAMTQNIELKAGNYQFSFYARNYNANNTSEIYVRVGDKNSYFDVKSGDYQKIVFDFELENDTNNVAKIETVGSADVLIAQAYLGKASPIMSEIDRQIELAKKAIQAEQDRLRKQAFDKIQAVERKTKFIHPLIDPEGNVIATGNVLVGNRKGGNAGIIGSGLLENDIRFYAGSPFDQRYNAPFRVLDNGNMYATRGKIAGFEINNRGLGKSNLKNGIFGAGTEMFLDDDGLIFTKTRKNLVEINGVSQFRYITTKTVINADGITTTEHDEFFPA